MLEIISLGLVHLLIHDLPAAVIQDGCKHAALTLLNLLTRLTANMPGSAPPYAAAVDACVALAEVPLIGDISLTRYTNAYPPSPSCRCTRGA